MSDAFWAGFFAVVALIVKDWLDSRRAERAARLVKVVAAKQEIATEERKKNVEAASAKMDDLAAKVEVIHKATNGMVKQLEEASFARGVKSETDKKT